VVRASDFHAAMSKAKGSRAQYGHAAEAYLAKLRAPRS
jgi:hypothetical protein